MVGAGLELFLLSPGLGLAAVRSEILFRGDLTNPVSGEATVKRSSVFDSLVGLS